MSTRDVVAENARLAVEVEALRLKAEMAWLERLVALAPGATDVKVAAETVSLLAWAGQPGRQQRPGP